MESFRSLGFLSPGVLHETPCQPGGGGWRPQLWAHLVPAGVQVAARQAGSTAPGAKEFFKNSSGAPLATPKTALCPGLWFVPSGKRAASPGPSFQPPCQQVPREGAGRCGGRVRG